MVAAAVSRRGRLLLLVFEAARGEGGKREREREEEKQRESFFAIAKGREGKRHWQGGGPPVNNISSALVTYALTLASHTQEKM